jgi:23S rRNA-/tRNA-specific pseudouridylate synthase
VLVGNEIATTSTHISSNQTISLLTRVQAAARAPQGASIQLEVAYEDDHMAAVVKPQGMTTIHMGTRKYDGLSVASCIKHVLKMPRLPGATG